MLCYPPASLTRRLNVQALTHSRIKSSRSACLRFPHAEFFTSLLDPEDVAIHPKSLQKTQIYHSGHQARQGANIRVLVVLCFCVSANQSRCANKSKACHPVGRSRHQQWQFCARRKLWPDLLAFINEVCSGCTPVIVAHNGRTFDFLLLLKELSRSELELPAHWVYVDTLDLWKVRSAEET